MHPTEFINLRYEVWFTDRITGVSHQADTMDIAIYPRTGENLNHVIERAEMVANAWLSTYGFSDFAHKGVIEIKPALSNPKRLAEHDSEGHPIQLPVLLNSNVTV